MQIEIPMSLTKTTPGTYRYDATDPNAVVSNVYVKKSAVEGTAPATVTVTISG